jgi:undecaprenyl-diphosphatase
MTDLIEAVLLGIIEGVTEFLPISSTGHLLIAQQWLGRRSDLFTVFIQVGAMLAVMAVYRQRLSRLATGIRIKQNREYVYKLAGAFFITAVLGGAAKLAGLELPTTVTPIAWALVLGALWMVAAQEWAARQVAHQGESSVITWRAAVFVGAAQAVAGMFPGTSRSAATIFAALLAGVTARGAATEFAFLVGIPTMFAAAGYEMLASEHALRNEDTAALLVGFAASAVTAFVVVKWLLAYIEHHRFTAFAAYRLVLGIALLALVPDVNEQP